MVSHRPRVCNIAIARVGEEHRNAARRRAWVRREDERRAEDSQAHWLANVRMRDVFRGRGHFVTNLSSESETIILPKNLKPVKICNYSDIETKP